MASEIMMPFRSRDVLREEGHMQSDGFPLSQNKEFTFDGIIFITFVLPRFRAGALHWMMSRLLNQLDLEGPLRTEAAGDLGGIVVGEADLTDLT